MWIWCLDAPMEDRLCTCSVPDVPLTVCILEWILSCEDQPHVLRRSTFYMIWNLSTIWKGIPCRKFMSVEKRHHIYMVRDFLTPYNICMFNHIRNTLIWNAIQMLKEHRKRWKLSRGSADYRKSYHDGCRAWDVRRCTYQIARHDRESSRQP